MKLIQLTAAALIVSAGAAFADTHITDGTVTKIDTKWNKVTVDHEELKNLDMPAMKMVFQVAEPEMLEKLSEGQSIQFAADRVNGKLTITEILE
ncbi:MULTISPECIES: copper-binding protein [unclassified Paracoccus (in: a-proteobacteria)]|uniref:copper-binding protein n=1 Tax=Paracoccus TaxID=265 RepID=UPI000CD0A997|nr:MULTISPECIES: copper-binding protein [unclassified Paracoccus (in: a-proteobacteria)]MDQ1901973.1 copper-binding protein [Paracoccus sp. WLY502]